MNIYKDALYTQGACNLGALVHAWDPIISFLQAKARAENHGTEWINKHPVNVLFVEQLHQLTGFSTRYSESLTECVQKAAADRPEDHTPAPTLTPTLYLVLGQLGSAFTIHDGELWIAPLRPDGTPNASAWTAVEPGEDAKTNAINDSIACLLKGVPRP